MYVATAKGYGAAVHMATLNAMTPRQARAARSILALSVRNLAGESGVSDSSIRRIEDGAASLDLRVKLQSYYERRGIRFVFDGHVRGVCWDER
jgi:hypothetical protein